jgi:hypothetical protein
MKPRHKMEARTETLSPPLLIQYSVHDLTLARICILACSYLLGLLGLLVFVLFLSTRPCTRSYRFLCIWPAMLRSAFDLALLALPEFLVL